MITRIRLNRKEGRIYREDKSGNIQYEGDSIIGVVLWISSPFIASLFGRDAQTWVQVAFILNDGNLAHFLLNSGFTHALKRWSDYQNGLAEVGLSPWNILTECGFEQIEDELFDYSFRAFSKPGIRDTVSRWIFANGDLPLIDETLPEDIYRRLRLGNKRYVKDLIPVISPSSSQTQKIQSVDSCNGHLGNLDEIPF